MKLHNIVTLLVAISSSLNVQASTAPDRLTSPLPIFAAEQELITTRDVGNFLTKTESNLYGPEYARKVRLISIAQYQGNQNNKPSNHLDRLINNSLKDEEYGNEKDLRQKIQKSINYIYDQMLRNKQSGKVFFVDEV